MTNRDFYIDKDGFKLHAKLDFPKKSSEKMPLLILIHGLTGQMDETHLEAVKDAANETGVACLRVDMYGHGKSDGDFSNHNVMEWTCELVYIMDYVKRLDFVSDIYLAGHSQGGLVGIMAAAIMADQIKALILLAPAINIVYDSLRGEFFGTQYDVNNIPEYIHFWDEYDIKGNYFRVARKVDINNAISAYNGPVLVVHGTGDDAVDVKYGIEVADKYSNSICKLIEGDTHCFDYHMDDMRQKVKEFLTSVIE